MRGGLRCSMPRMLHRGTWPSVWKGQGCQALLKPGPACQPTLVPMGRAQGGVGRCQVRRIWGRLQRTWALMMMTATRMTWGCCPPATRAHPGLLARRGPAAGAWAAAGWARASRCGCGRVSDPPPALCLLPVGMWGMWMHCKHMVGRQGRACLVPAAYVACLGRPRMAAVPRWASRAGRRA